MELGYLLHLFEKQFVLFKMENKIKEEMKDEYLTEARIIVANCLDKNITEEEFNEKIKSAFKETHSWVGKMKKMN